MKGEGLVPDATTSAAIGYAGGRIAYKTAREQALQGVDPQVAGQFGTNVASWTLAFYLIYVFSFVFVSWFMFAILTVNTPLAMLWFLGQCVLTWVLYQRLRAYRRSDPYTRLRYRISSKALVLLSVAWFSLALVGTGQHLMKPLYPAVDTPPGVVEEFVDYSGTCGSDGDRHVCTNEEMQRNAEVPQP